MTRIKDTQRLIRQTVGSGLRTAAVARVHAGSVDVRVGGSPKLLRGIPVIGELDKLRVGDTVLLQEADGKIYAQSFAARRDTWRNL